MKFQSGDRVVLAAVPEEGWVEEHGEFVAYEGNGMCLVQIDQRHLQDEHDDGFREIETHYVSREPRHA